ncbi:MAG: hypothetical protein AVDCRST_MAG45-436, partial [uncultured Solirubrobacterales bacterium]
GFEEAEPTLGRPRSWALADPGDSGPTAARRVRSSRPRAGVDQRRRGRGRERSLRAPRPLPRL